MTDNALTPAELDEIAARVNATTPGPWFVRLLDDDHAMNLVAVSIGSDDEPGERWPNFDSATIVAATLVQQPRYVDIADGRWNQNAAFIATARTDVPRLLAEVKRLRRVLDDKESQG